MIKKFCLVLLLTGIVSFGYAQEVKSVKFNDLEQILANETDNQVTVVNFWATWCKPCIEELPYFEELQQKYEPSQVKVILVSLDFTQNKAAQFATKKNLNSEVLYLDETDHNAWIDKISPDWTGAIPATLVINNKQGDKQFFERKFEKADLFSVIEKSLN